MRVGDEPLQFGVLRVLERFMSALRVGFREPDRARVCHVRGEESSEHFIADVVVSHDVEAGVGKRVGRSGKAADGAGEGRGEGRSVGQLVPVADE